jgi:hypothetical protein
MLDQFSLRVRIPHEIDRIFNNRFNYETGTIYYIESEEYEERIKLCYDLISEDLKVELVNFIKFSLPILKAEIISNKRNLKNKSEKTDFAKDYILAFVKLKYKFFSKWVEQKSTELQNNREITENKSLNIVKEKKVYDWHILIKPLVSGEINQIMRETTTRDIGKTEFSKLILKKLNLNIKVESIEPYIYYTFIKEKEDPKNLFSYNKRQTIQKYCISNNIEIKDEILLKKLEKDNGF